jgi:hypothetical protein
MGVMAPEAPRPVVTCELLRKAKVALPDAGEVVREAGVVGEVLEAEDVRAVDVWRVDDAGVEV